MDTGFGERGFLVKRAVTGPLATNTYVVKPSLGSTCMVVDPGDCGYEELLDRLGCEIVTVVATHGHFDHVLGVDCLEEGRVGAFLISEEDWPMVGASIEFARMNWGLDPAPLRSRPTGWLRDGDRLCVGPVCFTAMHTPGHSPGHMVLHLSPERGQGILFSGDLLFRGSVGRTDLPGGSWEELRRSLERLLARVRDGDLVLPGHGDATTVGEEKRFNPFLRELL